MEELNEGGVSIAAALCYIRQTVVVGGQLLI